MDDTTTTTNLPLQKLTISGPSLSSLITRFTSSSGPTEGLLFGRFSLHTPTSLSDDDDTPSSSPSALVATVSAFISTSATSSSAVHHPRHRLIGWFSGRRRSPLHPSLRESALSHSLSSTSSSAPFIFILLTTPFPETLIHTIEYRAYHYRADSLSFDPLPIDIVNVGPAFRGQYSAFCPTSQLPYLPCDFRGGSSPMKEDGEERCLSELKKLSKDQKDLDGYAQGFEIRNLSRLVGSDAASYMGGVEELYDKMLAKLHSLAKLVETSSAKVLEQENINTKLRYKVAGIE